MNCQKQNEICDYSIRLNWEGRGKKKAEPTAGFGQINLSTDTINTPRTEDGFGSTTVTPSMSAFSFQTEMPIANPQPDGFPEIESTQPRIEEVQNAQPRQPSSMGMIDPSLMPLDFTRPYTYLPEQQESYERYGSQTHDSQPPVQPFQISRLRQVQGELGSSDSEHRNPSLSTFPAQNASVSNVDNPTSVPPFFNNDAANEMNVNRPRKRARYGSSREGSPSSHTDMPPPSGPTSAAYSPFNTEYQTSPGNIPYPINTSSGPLTPASSYSDDGHRTYLPKLLSPGSQESPELRRLSVNSLLTGPPGYQYPADQSSTPRSNPEPNDWSIQYRDIYTDTTAYGVDRGIKDLDIGKNDDANAISGSSPLSMKDHLDYVLDEEGSERPVEFGFGMKSNSQAVEHAGYYDNPVTITLPKLLEPLPDKLLENPMNLLVSTIHLFRRKPTNISTVLRM